MSEFDDVKTTVGVIDGLRARIAELEAELAFSQDQRIASIDRLNGQTARAEQAEAERDAWRERCCETCENVQPWLVISQEPDLPYGNCMEAIGNFNGDDGQPAPNPPDFCCNYWTHKR